MENQDQNLQEELKKLQETAEEYLNGWKRARADFENYKKDEVKRFEEIIKFANKSLVAEFIPVLDSFDLAVAALEKDGKADKGIYMIKAQLEDVLRKNGLEKLIVSIGQSFDPALHEAVAEVNPPAGGDKPSGTIVEEVEKGYTLHGKLLRPARIKVAK